MGIVDLSDPFFEEVGLDQAWRLAATGSRSAWRLACQDTGRIHARLEALGARARVRAVAHALDWSKPTVLKFIRLGLIRRARRRRGAPRHEPFEIDVTSARWLVELCRRVVDRPPLPRHEFSRVRHRMELLGTNGDYRALPSRLTIKETAHFLRCSKSTVVRMIAEGEVWAQHSSPCRWEIRKHRLPWWCRKNIKSAS